jgi:probable rRNA maturation factor
MKAAGRSVARSARRFLARLGLSGRELSISLVGDSAIRRLNRRWRGKNAVTDVLSFPAGEPPRPGAPKLLGDVVISFDTAARCARKSGEVVERELERYLAHGLLHLLGYDHHTRRMAVAMAAKERQLLGDRGLI